MLSRDTEWRQGGILTHDSSCDLRLLHKDEFNKCVVVISHDCDLPNEKEDKVEVIVGTKIPGVDSSYSAARNIRCLHLTYKNINSSEIIYVELRHSERKEVLKSDFANLAKLKVNLPFDEKRTFKQWLAARYGRPAFPNEFEKRLQGDRKFHEKLVRILKPVNTYLKGIFFDLGEERYEELPIELPYHLKISLVYKGIEGPLARTHAENCAINITELFNNTFGDPAVAVQLVLESCEAVANNLFSLADLEKVDQWWRYDYISLQENPIAPFLPVGEISF